MAHEDKLFRHDLKRDEPEFSSLFEFFFALEKGSVSFRAYCCVRPFWKLARTDVINWDH